MKGWIKKCIVAVLVAGIVSAVIYLIYRCYTPIDREKLRDISYEIVEEENIPAEVYECIEENKDEINRLSYLCSDKLYIIVCYGAQPTGGYTIEVNQLYESSNAIIVETTLIGPSRQEKVEQIVSYPYIVLRVENVGKSVVFN